MAIQQVLAQVITTNNKKEQQNKQERTQKKNKWGMFVIIFILCVLICVHRLKTVSDYSRIYFLVNVCVFWLLEWMFKWLSDSYVCGKCVQTTFINKKVCKNIYSCRLNLYQWGTYAVHLCEMLLRHWYEMNVWMNKSFKKRGIIREFQARTKRWLTVRVQLNIDRQRGRTRKKIWKIERSL